MKKKIFALFLSLLMAVTLVLPANAAYENTHVNTGDQRKDIIAVAKTQLGYTEGRNNDTKYGDWYGLPNHEWCAMFVSWCANQAGIPTSVLRKYARSNPEGFGLKRLDGNSYRPQAGDLFFTKSLSHVGLVYYVDGDYFYSLEGNAGSGSNKVVSTRKKISSYYFGSPNYHGGAEHTYETRYETAHPHKEYKICVNCSDKYYTGKYGTSAGCITCKQASCSHTFGSWVSISSSKHKHTCSNCALEQTANHSWNAGTVIRETSCAHSGLLKQTCTGCGATREVTIAKTENHTFGEWTYMNEESHRRICEVCGKQEIATHDALDTWCTDETSHWHECATCNQMEISHNVHDFGDSCVDPCQTCGYVRPEGHSFATEWSSDASGHWHSCDNCSEKGDFTGHNYSADCDNSCDGCGYIRTDAAAHKQELLSDATGHWYQCSVCGLKEGYTAHNPGPEATEQTGQYCTICHFLIKEQLAHVHKYQFNTDGNTHWGICSCGHVLEQEAHVWDMGTGACAVCGMKAMAVEEPVNYDYVWFFFGAVVFGGAIIPIIAAVSRKKKEREIYA